ncbi:TPA: hypothetical protein ACIAP0_004783, partial [Salmonella enterica subsp. enterica serovar Agona]
SCMILSAYMTLPLLIAVFRILDKFKYFSESSLFNPHAINNPITIIAAVAIIIGAPESPKYQQLL